MTEHATNEQMATIMGWTLDGSIWHTIGFFRYHNNPQLNVGDPEEYWNPIENLNHAALVEARLAELGLHDGYVQIMRVFFRDVSPSNITWMLITASAQTRCDAAWATWSAWKEQQR
jgi:hypothetical protein